MIDETVWYEFIHSYYRLTAHYVKKIESGAELFICGVLIRKRGFVQTDPDLFNQPSSPCMDVVVSQINELSIFMFEWVISSTTDIERICYL
jgi:hypothetical protein